MVAKKTALAFKDAVEAGATGASRDAVKGAGREEPPGKKTAAKKAAAKKEAAPKKAPSKKAPAKKATAKKEAAGKAATKEAAAQKAPAKKTAAKKAVAKKAVVEKAATKKAPAKKTAAKKAVAGKGAVEKAASTKKAAAKKTASAKKAVPGKAAGVAAKKAATAAEGAAEAAEQRGTKKVVAKNTAGEASARKSAVPKARTVVAGVPGELPVRPGEDPWTPDEVAEARSELTGEVLRLRAEIEASETALSGLMRDSGDGAGDDDADTGTKNITREHEMALAANAREMLEQTERALERLDAGTYGYCEVCGNPIGKARMQAFPRATLCVEDKQKQERRG
ncbi:TraR/DksA C4-type zinc finger protein [Streptomyces sp. NPDC023838]|uniref:TraR/DksA family transcriptional regulator n=1 Tax=Streptomyces sp. NPDC023838 TaxID=3154325 RepID=UPI0033DD7412